MSTYKLQNLAMYLGLNQINKNFQLPNLFIRLKVGRFRQNEENDRFSFSPSSQSPGSYAYRFGSYVLRQQLGGGQCEIWFP